MLGPTASGKSEVAIELAARRNAPILSVDSMQVYRGMDIGTAKPSAEEQARVPHLMIDLVEPEVEFSVAQFQATARQLMNRHPEVFIVGGSGLHFRSVVDPLDFPPTDQGLRERLESVEDPVAALVVADPGATEIVDIKNPRRVLRALEIFHLTGETPTSRSRHPHRLRVKRYEALYEFRAVGLDPGTGLAERIAQRVELMREAGLWEEVGRLRHRLGRTASGAVGYRQLIRAIDGETTRAEGWAEIGRATLALARRQRTYFRRDPRIDWQPWEDDLDQRVAGVARALGIK
ncbi:MAG TPA: tRNA (adenosine(37)-N6)-dimethylallyltransferase MiaA [Acidimicrobiia bacterium]|nr:tRNA (adenosine(37)-N6)-dimethylallyltransferase MiaA [Acidimicrobiia bacterium]